jgi:Cu+-exporting ATPase
METIQKIESLNTVEQQNCYHCGDPNPNQTIQSNGNVFCCNGCKVVYELLEENNLCTYYDMENNPGTSPAEAGYEAKYQYLEDESVQSKIIDFTDGNTGTVTLYIPSMHCASCVWLLENSYKLNPLILSAKVDYLKKELTVKYEETASSLRQIVELLSSIGYEPEINLDSLHKKNDKLGNKDLYIKLGVAGFSFANIMMLSFPDYLALKDVVQHDLKNLFQGLILFLSLPVLFYSSLEYFKSAWNSWKQRAVNMDVPISIGIISLYARSLYEIFSASGSGYMDSFTGLVFLLLLGKLFEKKTYSALSFERDYRSYFPISVSRKTPESEESVSLEKLEVGDRLIIRNQEIIPADAILIKGNAFVDYSFVTGESDPHKKDNGDTIYAGGKQLGSAIEVDVVKEVNQSYLTRLWNDELFNKEERSRLVKMSTFVSRYFTMAVITIAFASALFWINESIALSLNAFTAVLIVACPCALALSTPFTLGNTLRIFGRNNFYLKNVGVIESLAKITHIVFDKTGTITRSRKSQIQFTALDSSIPNLSRREIQMVQSITRQSSHPISRQIFESFQDKTFETIENFEEIEGKGIAGELNSVKILLGSAQFVGVEEPYEKGHSNTVAWLSINHKIRGYFAIQNLYRSQLRKTVQKLIQNVSVSLISGDNDGQKENLQVFFPQNAEMFFNQSPFDKLNYVKNKQAAGDAILMVGDGLNDAGALKQSDAGISISEDINTFTPASDGILDAENFHRLADFLSFSRYSMKIIIASFIISFVYNIVGLSFAVQGILSPLIAAILMPVSSITVVLFTIGMTTIFAKKMKFKTWNRGAL